MLVPVLTASNGADIFIGRVSMSESVLKLETLSVSMRPSRTYRVSNRPICPIKLSIHTIKLKRVSFHPSCAKEYHARKVYQTGHIVQSYCQFVLSDSRAYQYAHRVNKQYQLAQGMCKECQFDLLRRKAHQQ